jgi:hypothetical protein
MVVTPTWTVQDQQVVPGPRHYESLTTPRASWRGATSVTWLDGEHYLTLQPLAPTPVQLPVSIEAIARLLNELAPLLFVAFPNNRSITGTSHPRVDATLEGAARSLRELWNMNRPSWDDDQRAMARHCSLSGKSARTSMTAISHAPA